jgi:hypothetical protein
MSGVDATVTVLKHDITRFLPIRVILREHEGKIEGYVEHSFSMDWSEKQVLIYWSGKAYSMLGEHQLDAIQWSKDNNVAAGGTIYDPLTEDCPIEIDWDKWLSATNKFDKRNAPFKLKAPK